MFLTAASISVEQIFTAKVRRREGRKEIWGKKAGEFSARAGRFPPRLANAPRNHRGLLIVTRAEVRRPFFMIGWRYRENYTIFILSTKGV